MSKNIMFTVSNEVSSKLERQLSFCRENGWSGCTKSGLLRAYILTAELDRDKVNTLMNTIGNDVTRGKVNNDNTRLDAMEESIRTLSDSLKAIVDIVNKKNNTDINIDVHDKVNNDVHDNSSKQAAIDKQDLIDNVVNKVSALESVDDDDRPPLDPRSSSI